MQPRNLHCSGAQGVMSLEGSSAARVAVEWVAQPAGCSITARVQEDEPVIWEALFVHGREGKVGVRRRSTSSGSAGIGSEPAPGGGA
jgi:hypothetical protein